MKKIQAPTTNIQEDSNIQAPNRVEAWTRVLARGLALFFGGFGVLNLAGNLVRPGFDLNVWWMDLRFVPSEVASPFLLAASVALIAFGILPPRSEWRRWITTGFTGALIAVAGANSITFYKLLLRGEISTHIPIPLSFFLAAGFALILASLTRQPREEPKRKGLMSTLAVFLVCVLSFPVAEMLCFGKTDYRRPADVAVVLGARVYADGQLSDALADRVRTGCNLYQTGLTRKLLFSGGPGDGEIQEVEAMKRMALELGVRREDIILDGGGINTQATVKNSLPVFKQLNASRVLVVSHFYHLPRIKLAYQRAGVEVYTVPAKESYLLRQMPFNMAREVAALWVYYLRPIYG
jgi:vancomycin permeability regulator SanA